MYKKTFHGVQFISVKLYGNVDDLRGSLYNFKCRLEITQSQSKYSTCILENRSTSRDKVSVMCSFFLRVTIIQSFLLFCPSVFSTFPIASQMWDVRVHRRADIIIIG